MRKKPLGVIAVPAATIEHDFAIQTKYQDFTAELLRLSLLGISGVGYVALKYLLPDDGPSATIPNPLRTPLGLALVCFGLSSVASLVHRYVSVDSLSWHLQSVRKEVRAEAGDDLSADADRRKRYREFLVSRYAVIVSAAALGLGACALVYGFRALATQ